MAFQELYVRPGGSNLNAGSENTDAARLTYASGTWVKATGVFTVASGDPVADGVVVGDLASIYADGASVTVSVGRVTARTTTTITILVDVTTGSGTTPSDGTSNRTVKIGGAWRGPNAAVAFPFGFVTTYLRSVSASSGCPRVNFLNSSTYSITAAMSHNVGGGNVVFEGMTATPGDGGVAIIDGGTSGASYVLLDILGTADNTVLRNITFQNNGATGSASGLTLNAQAPECVLDNVVVHDVRGWGIVVAGATPTTLIGCETYNCNQSNTAGLGGMDVSSASVIECQSHNNNGIGIRYGNTGTGNGATLLMDSQCWENTSHGFAANNHRSPVIIHGCFGWDNGGSGLFDDGSGAQQATVVIEYCVFELNDLYGMNLGGSGANSCFVLRSNAFYNNTSGDVNPPGLVTDIASCVIETGRITLSAEAFEDPGNGDFNINNDAGGGAVLRAVTFTIGA